MYSSLWPRGGKIAENVQPHGKYFKLEGLSLWRHADQYFEKNCQFEILIIGRHDVRETTLFKIIRGINDFRVASLTSCRR